VERSAARIEVRGHGDRKIAIRSLTKILDREERNLAEIYCHIVGETKRDEKRIFSHF
jgi:hypothetical protein